MAITTLIAKLKVLVRCNSKLSLFARLDRFIQNSKRRIAFEIDLNPDSLMGFDLSQLAPQ